MRKQAQNPGQSLKPASTKNVHDIKVIGSDKPIWDPVALQKAVAIEIKQRAERAIKAAELQEQTRRDKETEDMTYACKTIEAAYHSLDCIGIPRDTIIEALRHVTDLYD